MLKITENSSIEHVITNMNVEPGMLSTMYIGSDRYCYLVIAHPTRNTIIVDFFNKKPGNYYIDDDGIEYATNDCLKSAESWWDTINSNPDEDYTRRRHIFTWRAKAKAWFRKGNSALCGGLVIGQGNDYRDPDF